MDPKKSDKADSWAKLFKNFVPSPYNRREEFDLCWGDQDNGQTFKHRVRVETVSKIDRHQIVVQVQFAVRQMQGKPTWMEYNIPGRTLYCRADFEPKYREDGTVVIGKIFGKICWLDKNAINRQTMTLKGDAMAAMRT